MQIIQKEQDLAAESNRAWQAIRSVRKLAATGQTPAGAGAFAVDAHGGLRRHPADSVRGSLLWRPGAGWTFRSDGSTVSSQMFDLYLPVCGTGPGQTLVTGHLGQSLDGFIATGSGDSVFVNGQENILHLHRMRALCDAVIVGAETVAADNPRLTTRLVDGDNPVRVVLDPKGRLHPRYAVFCDGAAPTLLVCDRDLVDCKDARRGHTEVLGVRCSGGRLDLSELTQRLRERGLCVCFVEGGGITVSAFLQAGLLDRLQIAVAPVLIGKGRPGLQVPATAAMSACLRPRCRLFRMGEDVLFDCEPAAGAGGAAGTRAPSGIERVL
jgi:riboflavin-specific deaminase-like protein